MAMSANRRQQCEQQRGDEPGLVQARQVISSLLATAYRRSLAIERSREGTASEGDGELANKSRLSVHGDVP